MFFQLLLMIVVLAAALGTLAWYTSSPKRNERVVDQGKEPATLAHDR